MEQAEVLFSVVRRLEQQDVGLYLTTDESLPQTAWVTLNDISRSMHFAAKHVVLQKVGQLQDSRWWRRLQDWQLSPTNPV